MKLMRYGAKGAEKPALVDAQGTVRDLSSVIPDITAQTLTAGRPEAPGRSSMRRKLPAVAKPGRIAPPWSGMGKFICIGLNYSDHAAETGSPIPKEPIIFNKPTSALVGCNDPVVLPKDSLKTDWEVELGVVIGTKARYVEKADALKYVAGYCVVNDVSEREYQLERGGTWDKGKGCDTFGPVGPWMVTADEVADPQALAMWLDVNGQRRQNGIDRDDDLRRRRAGRLRQPLHDALAGRPDHHRNAARRRHGHEADAGVPEGGRRDAARHRRPRRAAAEGPRLGPQLIDE